MKFCIKIRLVLTPAVSQTDRIRTGKSWPASLFKRLAENDTIGDHPQYWTVLKYPNTHIMSLFVINLVFIFMRFTNTSMLHSIAITNKYHISRKIKNVTISKYHKTPSRPKQRLWWQYHTMSYYYYCSYSEQLAVSVST